MTADQQPGDPTEREPNGDEGLHDDPHPTTDDAVTSDGDWPTETAGNDAPPPPPPAAPAPPVSGTQPTPPNAIPADSRNWAMAAHLSAFVGAFFALAFVGPLVVWLIKRDEDAYVAHHAKEALNFNLSLLIYAAAGVILTVVTIGIGALVTIPLLAIAAIGWIVLTIVAAVKGANGEGYRYPLTLRLVN